MPGTLTFRQRGDVVIVDVIGQLTIGGDSAALRNLLLELADAGHRNVLLNMAGVQRIDAGGIGELVASYAHLARARGTIKLLNSRKPVKDVFRGTRMDSVFEEYEEESTAVLSFYSGHQRPLSDVVCAGVSSDAYLG